MEVFCIAPIVIHQRSAVAERDSCYIPWTSQIIGCLANEKILSALDASSGYRQIETDDKNVNQTAHVAPNELLKYTRMQFKLKGSPATFH